MSILEDYDYEYLESDDDDIDLLEEMGDDLLQLCDSAQVIEDHGITNTTASFMKRSGLLVDTSLYAIAVESMGSHGPDSAESHIAVEALLDKVKKTAVQWSGKILKFFEETGSSILSKVKDLWSGFEAKIKPVKKEAFTKLDNAKEYVKAHPYKTVAMALAAAVAVVGIVGFAVRGIPSYRNAKDIAGFTKKLTDMISAVKWPFGPITPKLIAGGKKLGVAIAGATAAVGLASIYKLGWDKVKADGLYNTIEDVNTSFQNAWAHAQPKITSVVGGAWDVVKGMASAPIEGATTGYNAGIDPGPYERVFNAAVGATFTTFLVWTGSVMMVLYKLIKTVVWTALKIGCTTIDLLISAVESR